MQRQCFLQLHYKRTLSRLEKNVQGIALVCFRFALQLNNTTTIYLLVPYTEQTPREYSDSIISYKESWNTSFKGIMSVIHLSSLSLCPRRYYLYAQIVYLSFMQTASQRSPCYDVTKLQQHHF